jgi:hypothetical protein
MEVSDEINALGKQHRCPLRRLQRPFGRVSGDKNPLLLTGYALRFSRLPSPYTGYPTPALWQQIVREQKYCLWREFWASRCGEIEGSVLLGYGTGSLASRILTSRPKVEMYKIFWTCFETSGSVTQALSTISSYRTYNYCFICTMHLC